ncbi:class I SAM-dependent DNA methyltransferase [Halalkalibacter akibai]|uniref:Methyltransferase n=1 Tax=Halalkalibacter akibai (strain ATCC 43226 / DSM 21942 / CIP 109018 / JCM 9157 / 1139) TaxID=1236973 RepID=W4QPR7_HALA3|nr:class I SAM-dependent methyltransferase [Halalkalibacter akibai]GAE33339.1 methyltransferase [Halalkalibacter akibai JCM 9157]
MNYQAFANLYDSLMADAPYEKWVDFIAQQVKQDLSGLSILDVGCGTGDLLLRLNKKGARVTGVDISEDMLAIAKEKCEHAGFSPPLFQQSMTELETIGEFDVITIFCDSLNYLETEKDVGDTFKSIYNLLKQGGLLLFDVHSVSKITGFINQTFAEDVGNMAYIWTSFPGEYPNSVEHEVTFFIENEQNGLFERNFELHKQRTFPVEVYLNWLDEAGFEITGTFGDFTLLEPTNESERIFFSVKKK